MKDLIDILLDENDSDPIVVTDQNGRQFTFEQIEIIPHDEKIYSVLKPIDHINGVADDEAIVFKVDKNKDGDSFLRIEDDEKIAIEIFDEYYNLLDEEINKSKGALDSASKTSDSQNQDENFSNIINTFKQKEDKKLEQKKRKGD